MGTRINTVRVMKRARRIRLIRIIAVTTLLFVFALWVASFMTAVVRFGDYSEQILCDGKITFIATELPTFTESGYNTNGRFCSAGYNLGDKSKIHGGCVSGIPFRYRRSQTPPFWDWSIPKWGFIKNRGFWSTRKFGVEWPSYERQGQMAFVDGKAKRVFVDVVELPLGSALLIAFAMTTMIFSKTRAFPPGHCQQCNYDLYKNTSNTCPECGTLAPVDLCNPPDSATGIPQ